MYVPIEEVWGRHEPYKPQIFPRKSGIRGNSTFYALRDLIDLLMIPRKIGGLPDHRGFITVRGYPNMALKKTAGETAGTAKKTAPKSGAAKKAAPKKAAGAGSTATKKKAAPKKAAGPKLSEPQTEMLKKVAGAGEAGFHAEKKPENKTLETLLKHKLVKKGKKHATSGHYHYSISKAGQKHLETSAASSSTAPKSS
jgi:hypothetical protein